MSTEDEQPPVLVEQDGASLVLRLNRPRQRNAMTLAAAELVAAAMDRLDDDAALRCAIVTGSGGHFCAGMDLKRFAELGERPHVAGRGFAGVVERPPRKPLIGAVEGWALGGGFELALACDVVVAAESARFGLPEVKRGLVARGGGLFRLPRALPRQAALSMALTGEPIGAARAYALGLVAEVVPDGTALDAARAIAERIATNGPLAVVASKDIVRRSWSWPEEECFDRQRPVVDEVFASRDAAEGARAFTEGRAARWTGR